MKSSNRKRPLDDEDRVLDDDVAVLLEGLLVETYLEPCRAVVQDESHPVGAAADFEHQARDRGRFALAPAPLARYARRASARRRRPAGRSLRT